jgi:hypothetical protein
MKLSFIVLFFIIFLSSTYCQSSFSNYWTYGRWTDAYDIIELPDKNFYCVGLNIKDTTVVDSVGQSHADQVRYCSVFKIDSSGNMLQNRFFYDTANTFYSQFQSLPDGAFNSILKISDSTFFVVGYTRLFGTSLYDNDIWILKMNNALDTIWSRKISISDSSCQLQNTIATLTSDKGIAVVGLLRHHQTYVANGFFEKIDSSGNVVLHKILGTDVLPYSAIECSDKGFLITGAKVINSFNGDFSPYLIKLDSTTNITWTKSTFDTLGFNQCQNSIQSADSSLIYVWRTAYHSYMGIYPIHYYHASKVDNAGNEIWTKQYVFTHQHTSHQSIASSTNGNFIIAGQYADTISHIGKVYLTKCSPNGDSLWSKQLLFTPWPKIYRGIATSDGGYIFTGSTDCCTPGSSLYVLKIDSLGLITSNGPEKPLAHTIYFGDLFPNPSSDNVNFNVEFLHPMKNAHLLVYDNIGRQIKKIELNSLNNIGQFSLENFAKGIYIVVLSVEGYNCGAQKISKTF